LRGNCKLPFIVSFFKYNFIFLDIKASLYSSPKLYKIRNVLTTDIKKYKTLLSTFFEKDIMETL